MTVEATQKHQPSAVPIRALKVSVVEGDEAGASQIAKSDTFTIGSAKGNDLTLSDSTVSRYHLELRRIDGRIYAVDLGSTNGTRTGSVVLGQAFVEPGSVLRLGRSAVKVDDGDPIEIELHAEDALGGLRGGSKVMRALMSKLERVASSSASVLLIGETGTGKERVAQAIHEASPRSEGPFEAVDCGSLMPTLIASELFGHEAGAFTGADRKHVGAFERADGGTLFLDEIGELPPSLQPVLLGALERRRFRRVGGTAPIEVDVRVVSATNRDLRAEVNSGGFREDLFYRIAVVMLTVPPLRDRAGDISILIEHFARSMGHSGEVRDLIGPDELAALEAYQWPGNVRELRNFVEAALALGEPPSLAASSSGEQDDGDHQGGFSNLSVPQLVAMPYKDARRAVLDEFEDAYFKVLLEKDGGNIAAVARAANMNRSYLIDLLKRRGLR